MFMLGVNYNGMAMHMHISYELRFPPGPAIPPVHGHPPVCTYLRKMLSYTPNITHPPSRPVVMPRKILFGYLCGGLRDGRLLSLDPISMSTSAELVTSR